MEGLVQTVPTRRRTVGIWMIAIWFFVGGAFSLASFIAVKVGAIPIDQTQQLQFDRLGAIDHIASVLIAVANVLGAVFLLMLRRIAVYLFWSSLAVNLLLISWHVANKGAAAVLGGGLVGIVFGLSLLGGVCLYVVKLSQRQVLV